MSKPWLMESGGSSPLTSMSSASRSFTARAYSTRLSRWNGRRPGLGVTGAAVSMRVSSAAASASSVCSSGRRAPGGGIMPARSLRIIFSADVGVLGRGGQRRTTASERPPALPALAVTPCAILPHRARLRIQRPADPARLRLSRLRTPADRDHDLLHRRDRRFMRQRVYERRRNRISTIWFRDDLSHSFRASIATATLLYNFATRFPLERKRGSMNLVRRAVLGMLCMLASDGRARAGSDRFHRRCRDRQPATR